MSSPKEEREKFTMPFPKFGRQEGCGRSGVFGTPGPGGNDTSARSSVGQGDTGGSVHVHQDHNEGHTGSISDSASVSRAQVHPRTTKCKSSVVDGGSRRNRDVNEESSRYDSTRSRGRGRYPIEREYGGPPGSSYRRRSPPGDRDHRRRRSASPGSRARSPYRRELYRRSDWSRSRSRSRSSEHFRSSYPDHSRLRYPGRSCSLRKSSPYRRSRTPFNRDPYSRARSPYHRDPDRRRNQQNRRRYFNDSYYRTSYSPRSSYDGRRSNRGPRAQGSARSGGYFTGGDKKAQGGPRRGSHPQDHYPDRYLNNRSCWLGSRRPHPEEKSGDHRFQYSENYRDPRRLSPYSEDETPGGDCQEGTTAQGSDHGGSEGGKGTPPPPTQDMHPDRQ
ncbi:hypothetical protein HOY80DRAFT_788350 [Tuber brumale]|nr:hypothetical protein HOY80DRAFT_788350 [Tuber brumale]